jgi:cytoskeleton protein RodZ
LPSFGERLKLEREKRKITLEQISATTKISTRMLQALEEEKFTQLPGGIFNKGFVRAYARMLGLDEEQAISDYLEASGEAPPVRAELAGRESASRGTPVRITDDNSGRLEIRAEMASRQLPWGVFAVVLLIVALALSLWSHRRREQERLAHPSRPVQSSETGSVSSNRSSSDGSAPLYGSASAPSSTSATASPAVSPVSAAEPSTAAISTDKNSTAPPSQTPTAVNPAPAEFVVTVHARDESWLSVVVDGQPVGSETLAAGDQRAFHGRKLVIAKVGNAAALDFQFNGKALLVGGVAGEVKKVTIGPTGLVPEPAMPPAP